MTIKTIIIAAAIALTAFGAQASDSITFPNNRVMADYVASEIERGFGLLNGDVNTKRVGVAQLKAYLEGRRQDALISGAGPQRDEIAERLGRSVSEIEAELAL